MRFNKFLRIAKVCATNLLLMATSFLILGEQAVFHGDLVLAEEFDAMYDEVVTVDAATFDDVQIAGETTTDAIDAVESYPYTKIFRTSAYYSPLPCQTRYVTGSYEGDVRLNGSGVNSADGTPVYAGMIAAPRNYAFGTKMHISGLGYGAVHDRGGAIVANGAAGYDRLDIWMGYGDAGLRRALQWGKRNVEVTVYGVDPSVPEDMNFDGYSPSEKNCEFVPPVVEFQEEEEAVPEVTEEVTTEVEVELSEGLNEDLELGDSGEEVEALQEELISLNFLRGEPSGVYDELTAHAVFKFQQSQMLVGHQDSTGAGVFGPKTRARLNGLIASRNETRVLVADASSNYENQAIEEGRDFFLARELDPGVVAPEVKVLQVFLKEQGFFTAAYFSNFYGPMTTDAVLSFQLKHNIIASAADTGAGRVGPKTMQAINNLQ